MKNASAGDKRGRSLRFSLSTAFVVLIFSACLLLGAVLFFTIRNEMDTTLRQNLAELVSSFSLLVDAEEHAALVESQDMDSESYKKYRGLIAKFIADHPDIRFLYSIRRSQDGTLRFVLDSGTTEEDYSPLGMVYENQDEELLSFFKKTEGVWVMSGFQKDEWGLWLSAFMPLVRKDGSVDALLGMDMSAEDIVRNETRMVLIILGIALVVAILGMLIGVVVSRRIARPLLAVAGDMEKIQRFELEPTKFAKSQISEVILMETALENMKKGLRSFRKYVPADVVSQLVTLQKEAVLETRKETLTVFFSDLENFTGAAEKVGVERIADILGPYFEVMTGALQSRNATVDKFIGDAVMAFWNAPMPEPDHVYKACMAALDCSRAVQELAPSWQKDGIAGLRTRIGINTGAAVVGNIGFAERLSYTALGDTVNLASRLESLNKFYGTGILISETSWNGLGGRLPGRLVDRVAVKGRTQAGGVYELMHEVPLWMSTWEDAMGLYFRQKFSEAATLFGMILKIQAGDGPATVLKERCERLEQVTPENWDGVTVMHDK